MARRADDPSFEQLASSFRVVFTRLARRVRAQRKEDSIGPSQLTSLITLSNLGPMTPAELAVAEKTTRASITRIVAALLRHGYVTRDDHEHDGRQVIITITEDGRGIVKQDRERRQAWLVRMLEDLPEDDLAQLAAVLPILERLTEID